MRRLAVRRVKAGESQNSVAESLEVHPRTVSKWYTAERNAGPEALASTKSSGRPPGLTEEERAVLLGLIVGKTVRRQLEIPPDDNQKYRVGVF